VRPFDPFSLELECAPHVKDEWPCGVITKALELPWGDGDGLKLTQVVSGDRRHVGGLRRSRRDHLHALDQL
jgi:hypothetical protein